MLSTFATSSVLSTIKQTPISSITRAFSSLPCLPLKYSVKPLLTVKDMWNTTSTRTVIKHSLKSGKKNTVNAVIHRFHRLDSGLWIRRMGGYRKSKYLKSEKRLWYADQHIFCNEQQSLMLDKMVTDFWKKKKYYIDDPFEPYHRRNNLDYVPPYRPWNVYAMRKMYKTF